MDLFSIENENGEQFVCYGSQNRAIVLNSKTSTFANFLHTNKEFVSSSIRILKNYEISQILEMLFHENQIVIVPILEPIQNFQNENFSFNYDENGEAYKVQLLARTNSSQSTNT